MASRTPTTLASSAESAFGGVRDRVAALRRVAYRKVPILTVFGIYSFGGLERVGEHATRTHKRQLSLLSVGMMLMLFGSPVAAAPATGCKSGPLSFLGDLYGIITKSAGLIVLSMVILAGLLKMIPARGTNSWGNAIVGSVIIGIVFLVLGPALVKLAGKSTPINMKAQCAGGG